MLIRIFQRTCHLRDLVLICSGVLLIIYLILPHRFASHYTYISADKISRTLIAQVTQNISLQELFDCTYDEIINGNTYVYGPHYREHVLRGEEILPGGEYFPEHCRARFSTAIIVPYRQREEQLHKFLIYIHNYLRHQDIHYRIFLIEQYDQKPFNRAKLFNIGSEIAMEYDFPCLILHDVDLLPLNSGQLYACTKQPRHMSAALDNWRYQLPYAGLFGGVVAINMKIFKSINGMSNLYHGWGGEDDDLLIRIYENGFWIVRFAPGYSEYTMLKHKPESPNKNRIALLNSSIKRVKTDGLNSLVYQEVERRMHSLFTHILVLT